MKKTLLLLAASLAVCSTIRADTSYLLIQGPFGPGNVTETYKWKVHYEHGSLITSIDLMNAVLGTATNTGTTYLGNDLYTAENSTLGASYIDFNFGGEISLFTVSITVNSITLLMDNTFDPSWNFHIAGGSGAAETPYPAGVWTSGDNVWDGLNTRTLSNGSYDAWVWGSYPAPVANSSSPGDNNPVSGNFASATVVNAVPEPGSAALLLLGVAGLFLRRRRP